MYSNGDYASQVGGVPARAPSYAAAAAGKHPAPAPQTSGPILSSTSIGRGDDAMQPPNAVSGVAPGLGRRPGLAPLFMTPAEATTWTAAAADSSLSDRSSSAPPAFPSLTRDQAPTTPLSISSDVDGDEEDFRREDWYRRYYYASRLQNPRLPPPLPQRSTAGGHGRDVPELLRDFASMSVAGRGRAPGDPVAQQSTRPTDVPMDHPSGGVHGDPAAEWAERAGGVRPGPSVTQRAPGPGPHPSGSGWPGWLPMMDGGAMHHHPPGYPYGHAGAAGMMPAYPPMPYPVPAMGNHPRAPGGGASALPEQLGQRAGHARGAVVGAHHPPPFPGPAQPNPHEALRAAQADTTTFSYAPGGRVGEERRSGRHPPQHSGSTATAPRRSRRSASGESDAPKPAAHADDTGAGHAKGRRRRRNQKSARSEFLEAFRAARGRGYALGDIVDHALEFCLDQMGSRFIQRVFPSSSPDAKAVFIKSILPHTLDISQDIFGNYVIQLVLENSSESERTAVFHVMEGNILALSVNAYGCRVVQKALESLATPAKLAIAEELVPSIDSLLRDEHGNHVAQKCIETIPLPLSQFVYDAIERDAVELSRHPFACRVVQRVLERNDNRVTTVICDKVLEQCAHLFTDQYANYVLQHVSRFGTPEQKDVLVRYVSGRVLDLARHKYGSNVLERLLAHAGAEVTQVVLNEVLEAERTSEAVRHLLEDKFGNYVIQKLLVAATGNGRAEITSAVLRYRDTLEKLPYGRSILAKAQP